MNTSDNQTRKRSPHRRHWARRSHRVVAIGAFSFLILIALTGLLLNHADDLGLPQATISSVVAKRVYGIEAPPIEAVFAAGEFVFVTVDNTVYADVTPIAFDAGTILGAVVNDSMIVIATDRELILTTVDAVPIERTGIDSAQALSRIGHYESRVVVATSDGIFALDTNRMILTPLEMMPTNMSWSEPILISDEQRQRIDTATVGQIISWERMLLDLHSGRILPVVGRYLFDLTALCLLYLCMSGVLLWFRKR